MQAPTAIAVFPKEIWTYPKSWCAKQYNLKRWTIMPAGGESGLFHSASCPLLLHNDCGRLAKNICSGGSLSVQDVSNVRHVQGTLQHWRSLSS